MIAHGLPRAVRIEAVLERDGHDCVWCRRPLEAGHRDLSVEHLVPRLKGGPSWPENELAACRSCNRARGHSSPERWLEQCEARGWSPNRPVVERQLVELDAAIARRGGQRKARPYLAAQLRRLGLAA